MKKRHWKLLQDPEFFLVEQDETNLQKFISDNACKIHNLKFEKDKIVILEKQEWQVAQKYGDVVPFMAGKTLNFKVAN